MLLFARYGSDMIGCGMTAQDGEIRTTGIQSRHALSADP
jgi:hypothetical protein